MINQPMHSGESEEDMNPFALELLEALLQEEPLYPWNPAALETEEYLTELEQSFTLLDSSDLEEITCGAETLFSHLHQCWASSSSETSGLKGFLANKFGELVPSSWLEAIAEQAEQIVSANLSPLHQLIECVKPLLSEWAEEDLQIFARPLAYSMRGTNFIKQSPWDELSEIDKIRLSMVVAQDALLQLQTETTNIP